MGDRTAAEFRPLILAELAKGDLYLSPMELSIGPRNREEYEAMCEALDGLIADGQVLMPRGYRLASDPKQSMLASELVAMVQAGIAKYGDVEVMRRVWDAPHGPENRRLGPEHVGFHEWETGRGESARVMRAIVIDGT